MMGLRLGEMSLFSSTQGQLWRNIRAPPVLMGMSLKSQEMESLQQCWTGRGKPTGKNLNRRGPARIQGKIFSQEDIQAVAQVSKWHFEVSSPNRMKPWEAWPQSWPCCGQEIGLETVWGPSQPLILCFSHSHSHGVMSNILHCTQILLALQCYRDTTDRVPRSLLF